MPTETSWSGRIKNVEPRTHGPRFGIHPADFRVGTAKVEISRNSPAEGERLDDTAEYQSAQLEPEVRKYGRYSKLGSSELFRKHAPFCLRQCTARRAVTTLMLLVLMAVVLPAPSGAQQTCQPDGDVDQNGSVTAADAVLAFQHALGQAQLNACQLSIADVFPSPATPDGTLTASDALCIFRKALGSPSCLDGAPPSSQPPTADAGSDQPGEQGFDLSGTVRNHATGDGIAGAGVRVTRYASGAAQELGAAVTDNNGFYEIALAPASGRATVKAEADDFVPQSVIVVLKEGMGSVAATLAMVPVDVVHSFQPTRDTEIVKGDQPLVEVAANSLTTASGSAPAGTVMAMVTNLDASSDVAVMPGDFMTVDGSTADGEPIESFAAMNVMFTGENGESLNLASGQEATVLIPLAGRRDPLSAPETTPLFYWSDESGQWIEEGEAILEEVVLGKWAYVGRVSHFSTWTAARRYETIRLRGSVEDGEGNPAAFARVTAQGRDYIGSTSATTDTNGLFDISVRRESEILLSATDGVHGDSLALSTGSASRTLNAHLTLMPASCTSYVPGTIADRVAVSETTHPGPEGLSAPGLDVDNAVFNWRWQVAPVPEPAPPGELDPNNGIFVAAKAVDIAGPDGLMALGYEIRVADPPDVTGLVAGRDYNRRNDQGERDGLHVGYRSGPRPGYCVTYWDNGAMLSTACYHDGKPDGKFLSYVNGKLEGVQFRFGYNRSVSWWAFGHYCGGTRHGRTGTYINGKPQGSFLSYVNGKLEGAQQGIRHRFARHGGGIIGDSIFDFDNSARRWPDGPYDFLNDYWEFETYSAGMHHGPTGEYRNGEPHGRFRSYVDGEMEGIQHTYVGPAYSNDGIITGDTWKFMTYSAGTRHGRTGWYENGEPDGQFNNYVNGESGGVWHSIYPDKGRWSFITYPIGLTGSYHNDPTAGWLRDGWFGYKYLTTRPTVSSRYWSCGTHTHYRNGVRTKEKDSGPCPECGSVELYDPFQQCVTVPSRTTSKQ